MTNIRNVFEVPIIECGSTVLTRKVDTFKYLGEIIQVNGLHKETNKEKIKKN